MTQCCRSDESPDGGRNTTDDYEIYQASKATLTYTLLTIQLVQEDRLNRLNGVVTTESPQSAAYTHTGFTPNQRATRPAGFRTVRKVTLNPFGSAYLNWSHRQMWTQAQTLAILV